MIGPISSTPISSLPLANGDVAANIAFALSVPGVSINVMVPPPFFMRPVQGSMSDQDAVTSTILPTQQANLSVLNCGEGSL